jgi:hypothetical protein
MLSSIEEYMGYFHFLGIINNAAMNIGYIISSSPCFQFVEVKLLEHMVGNPRSDFLRNCHTVFHFTFPPAVHKGSYFSTFSPTLNVFCFLIVAVVMGVRLNHFM